MKSILIFSKFFKHEFCLATNLNLANQLHLCDMLIIPHFWEKSKRPKGQIREYGLN